MNGRKCQVTLKHCIVLHCFSLYKIVVMHIIKYFSIFFKDAYYLNIQICTYVYYISKKDTILYRYPAVNMFLCIHKW